MSSKANLISKSHKIKAGITIGDPSGIGPAITIKAINKLKGLADFVIIGDNRVLNKALGSTFAIDSFRLIDLNNVSRKNFSFGKVNAEYGRASIEYLDKAIGLLRNKEIDCLITCPISKEAINLAGFRYSGHTEYFAEKTNTKDTVMMLLNKYLRFSLITRHIPLKDVPRRINARDIYNNIKITSRGLKRLFLIGKPRMVVCGLNPHASDNGVIGDEDDKIIYPAVVKSKDMLRVDIEGPFSSDVAVRKAYAGDYDCVIAMYHDQALIPLKLLSPETGVNLTLGLPFIRTSPLHGTAFDIAKSPSLTKADSLIEAIRLAIKCVLNQKKD